MKALESVVLGSVPGLLHGFGTLEEPFPVGIQPAWAKARPEWRQVHGADLCEVRQANQKCGEVDALLSRTAGLPVAVVTADCVPVLLARRSGGAAAAVHAGWRGTQARILLKLWDALTRLGEKPSEWVAAVGPAIGPCCYQVSPELAESFVRDFSAAGSALVEPRSRMLDLPAINAWELRQLGLPQVEILRSCTKCSGGPGRPEFHSYRRAGGGTRQWSAILAL